MKRNYKRYILIGLPIVLLIVIICILVQINSVAPVSFNGVAYTINGIDVYENDISEIVSDYRKVNNLEDNEEWNQAKADANLDSIGVRNQIVYELTNMYGTDICAEKYNIEVSEAEVDYYLQHEGFVLNKASEYTNLLNSFYDTILDKREQVRLELKKHKIWLKHAADYQVVDEDIDDYIMSYGDSLNKNKAYSLIVVDKRNSGFLADLSSDIKSGKLSFEDAAYAASVNWPNYVLSIPYVVYYDNSFSFVDPMYKVIPSSLGVGQVSDVLNYYGYDLIAKYEGLVTAPENVTSKDQLSSTVLEQIKWQIISNKYEKVITEGEEKEEENFNFVLYYPWFGLPY